MRAPGEQPRDVSALHTTEHVDSRLPPRRRPRAAHELLQRSLAADRQAAVPSSPATSSKASSRVSMPFHGSSPARKRIGPSSPAPRVGGRLEGPDVDAVGKLAHAGTAGPVQALARGGRREQQHGGPALL